MPSIELPPADWRTIAEFVQTRRNLLGHTQGTAVAAGGQGISIPVWSVLENGRQENGRMSLAAMAAAGRALRLPTKGKWWEQVLDGTLEVDFDQALDEIQVGKALPRTSTETLRAIAAGVNKELQGRE